MESKMKNVRKKLSYTCLGIIFVLLCACGEVEWRYVKTKKGLVRAGEFYCVLGMLVNNERENVLDEDSRPITCDGYISLTHKKKREWDLNNSNQQ